MGMAKRNKGLDRPRNERDRLLELSSCVSVGIVDSKFGDDHNRKSMQFGEPRPSELWGRGR